jgi:radical SAM superfamily enzyme YgiQ (UPF0313 family)
MFMVVSMVIVVVFMVVVLIHAIIGRLEIGRQMAEIVLSTLNARFKHTSLGLRYLLANLGDLRDRTQIQEFVLGTKTEVMVEALLAAHPKVIGLGVYIWNVDEMTKLVGMLKAVAPEVKIVLGGPEVSFETQEQAIVQWADHVITGQADLSFPQLARALLHGPRPLMKIIPGIEPDLDTLVMPYEEFTDADLAQRLLYVEASRGCPFKCEFCLSSLDKTATPFPLDAFLAQLEALYLRGARLFKFVDRTFNLNIKTSQRILEFFLEKIECNPQDLVFAHFELVPDHLPPALKDTIQKFPEGTLQFEIGIQTWNPQVQANISRRQKNDKAIENITWLVEHTHAHLHVDLIIGLPGENIDSFGRGFDLLASLKPHEIQVGVLKRLRGTPIIRHTQDFDIRYNPTPPYNILSNRDLDFPQMQRLTRFARYWDLIGNSGRYTRSLPLLLAGPQADSAFDRFLAFSDWLYATTGATHQIASERLFDAVHEWLVDGGNGGQSDDIEQLLLADFEATGAKGRLRFMRKGLAVGQKPPAPLSAAARRATPLRQARALSTSQE